jgi:hypothetical protein
MMHAIEISANGGPEPRAAAELCIALETARRAPSAN